MYNYHVFGLIVSSDFELFGVTTVDSEMPPDVIVRRIDMRHPSENEFVEGRFVDATIHQAHLSWLKLGSIKVLDGREIHVCPLDGISDTLLSLFITGAAMGVLLHQRGYLVLHASAVQIGKKGAAFIGFKGMGKSTTAASLVGRGHGLISDDIVAVDANYLARPGSEMVKLWPAALEAALNDSPDSVPKIYPSIEKRAKSLRESIVDEAVEIAAVYVLDAGTELSVERVDPAAAFIEIMRHSYAPRFVGSGGTPPEHFSQCTRFALNVPIFRLKRVPDLNELTNVAALVESHFSDLYSSHE